MGNVGDFDPENLPFIEFSEPDFPWRYSPEKLRPWILLVILEEKEFSWSKYATKNKAPSIKVYSAAKSLPNLNYSYLSDYVKIIGNDEKSSRILCPRRLDEKRKYYAFLVPIFKREFLLILRLKKKQETRWNMLGRITAKNQSNWNIMLIGNLVR